MDWLRTMRHLSSPLRRERALFDQATLLRLQEIITAGEANHRAELRLVVESAMPLRKLRRGTSPRQRALDLFGTLRAWDTEENNGVLLYVNLCDHALEIIADRGATRVAGDQRWLYALGLAHDEFRQGRFEAGLTVALEAMGQALAAGFPARRADANAERRPLPSNTAPARGV